MRITNELVAESIFYLRLVVGLWWVWTEILAAVKYLGRILVIATVILGRRWLKLILRAVDFCVMKSLGS